MGTLQGELGRVFHTHPPCRKVRHKTQGEALAHMRQLLAAPNCVRPEALQVYPCHRCGDWHVGRDRLEGGLR